MKSDNQIARSPLFLFPVLILIFLLSSCGTEGPAPQNTQTPDPSAPVSRMPLPDENIGSDGRDFLSPKDTADSDGQIFDASGKDSGQSDQNSSSSCENSHMSGQTPDTSHIPYTAYPSVSGALQVNGTQLTDENGLAVQLKGISTHGLAWFPQYINEECFRQLREEWNVNVIRLAIYTAEYGGYCSGGDQDALKELVRKGVDYAAQLDLYVIIDWHILSDNNPNTHLDQAKAFFEEMAEACASCGNVLYEICNEPNGSTSWSDIKTYAQELIPVIRSHDEDGIIIVGTPNWSQYVDQAAADPLTGCDNIMYSLHFYAATHTDSLRKTMTDAIEAGLPVFVSEYGICDASGNGSIDENQAGQWIDIMDQYGVSYVAWNLSNKNETSAVLSHSCDKSFGFTKDDLSPSGKWLYDMLTGESSPAKSQNQDDGSPGQTDSAHRQTPAPSAEPTDSVPRQTPAPSAEPTDSVPVSFSANLVNSWESEGLSYYQYELTLQNPSGTDCTGWAVDVPFSEVFSLSDCWNGEYTVSGQTLHITNKDYNGSIPSGGSMNHIGFIVCGGKALAISQ